MRSSFVREPLDASATVEAAMELYMDRQDENEHYLLREWIFSI